MWSRFGPQERYYLSTPPAGRAPCYCGLSENVKDWEEQNIMPPKFQVSNEVQRNPKLHWNQRLLGWLWFQRMLQGCLYHGQRLHRTTPKEILSPSPEIWVPTKGGQAKAALTSTSILWSCAAQAPAALFDTAGHWRNPPGPALAQNGPQLYLASALTGAISIAPASCLHVPISQARE